MGEIGRSTVSARQLFGFSFDNHRSILRLLRIRRGGVGKQQNCKRHERSVIGVVFVVAAMLIAVVMLHAFEIAHGAMPLASPKSDGALVIFLGLIALLVLAYIIGNRVAHLLRRSQVRFYRVYRHQ
jgi:uncharacterized membrane protein YidH (DUF202 family)